MDRRRFLAAGSISALTTLLGGAAGWPRARGNWEHLAHPQTLSRLGDSDLPRLLGRRYRAAFPDEDDPLLLRRTLRREAKSVRESALTAGLQARIRQDFAEDRTVELEGWILARTEARQCALFSLHHA